MTNSKEGLGMYSLEEWKQNQPESCVNCKHLSSVAPFLCSAYGVEIKRPSIHTGCKGDKWAPLESESESPLGILKRKNREERERKERAKERGLREFLKGRHVE